MNWMDEVGGRIVGCQACPRLVAHRAAVAQNPPRRFQGEIYHARGVPGFGDPLARLWIIGLAPAAHGANRTGRMFTGDRSGEWLYRILYEVGLSSAPESRCPADGLRLYGVFISAVVRCAPPQNRPLPSEISSCQTYLHQEWEYLRREVRVVLALGSLAHREAAKLLRFARGPAFSHGALYEAPQGVRLLASYHPSQQNTFTRRLTWPMWREVFEKACQLMV